MAYHLWVLNIHATSLHARGQSYKSFHTLGPICKHILRCEKCYRIGPGSIMGFVLCKMHSTCSTLCLNFCIRLSLSFYFSNYCAYFNGTYLIKCVLAIFEISKNLQIKFSFKTSTSSYEFISLRPIFTSKQPVLN
jgi:hypothetical protein